MRVVNLTGSAIGILLTTQDLIVKPYSMSAEFFLTEKVFKNLISTVDYQNKYRFVMDASERSMMANLGHSIIQGVLVTPDEANKIVKDMSVKVFPERLDILGNPEKPKVEEPADAAPVDEGKKENEDQGGTEGEGSKETEEPIDPEFNWDGESKGVKLKEVNEKTKYRKLINPANLPVKYSSSNEEVAMIDENTGDIVPVAEGEAIITAKTEGNEQFKSAETSFKLIVK